MDREDQLVAKAQELETSGSEWFADGRYEQAAGDFEEAAEIYRDLAVADPDRYALRLAAEINNLALAWSKLRLYDEAVDALTEAVRLAGPYDDQPEVRPLLGGITAALANALAELDRFPEAMTISERAVKLRRGLHPGDDLVPDPELAKTLRSYAKIRTLAATDLDRALATIEEAVAIYRELAAVDPAQYEAELFAGYEVMAAVLDRVGRRDEATALRAFLADKIY